MAEIPVTLPKTVVDAIATATASMGLFPINPAREQKVKITSDKLKNASPNQIKSLLYIDSSKIWEEYECVKTKAESDEIEYIDKKTGYPKKMRNATWKAIETGSFFGITDENNTPVKLS